MNETKTHSHHDANQNNTSEPPQLPKKGILVVDQEHRLLEVSGTECVLLHCRTKCLLDGLSLDSSPQDEEVFVIYPLEKLRSIVQDLSDQE